MDLMNSFQEDVMEEVFMNNEYCLELDYLVDLEENLVAVLVDNNPELMERLLSGVRYTLSAKLEQYKDDPQGFMD